MEHEHVIGGLIRKRQEISAEMDRTESKLRQLILDIDAVDATLRLFQPDIDLAVVRVRPTPRRHEASRGDTSRLILNLLREASGPLSRRDIVSAIMEARGLNQADRALLATMRERIGASLKGLRQRGRLRTEGQGAGVRWSLMG